MALELNVNILKLSATALAGLFTGRCVFVNIVEVPALRNENAEMKHRRKSFLLASIQAGLGMATVASGVAVYLLDESDNRNIWILGSGLMASIFPWEMIVIIMLDIYRRLEAHVMREREFHNRNIWTLVFGLMAYIIPWARNVMMPDFHRLLDVNVVRDQDFDNRKIWRLGSGVMAYIIPWTRIVMMPDFKRLLEANVMRERDFDNRNIWILGSGLMAYIIPWTMIVMMPDIKRLLVDNVVRKRGFHWIWKKIEVLNKLQHMLRSLVGLSVFGMFLYAI